MPGLGSQFRGPVVLASGVWKGGRKLYQTDGNTECDEVYQDLTPYKGRLTTTANLRQNDKIIAVGAEQIEYPMRKTLGTPNCTATPRHTRYRWRPCCRQESLHYFAFNAFSPPSTGRALMPSMVGDTGLRL